MMERQMSEFSLARIGLLVKEGDVKKTHNMIVYLFQLWLEREGVGRENMKIMEEYRGLSPDIIVYSESDIISVWEIIEPDQEWDLLAQEVRRKLENIVLRAYAYVYKPRAIVLTNGIQFYIYDKMLNPIREILDLSKINKNDEEELKHYLIY